MTEEREIKRRGPRTARNKVQEMAKAAKHFEKAVEGYAAVAASKYGIEQSSDLKALLEAMTAASEAAKGVYKAFEPHYEAMRQTAELINDKAKLELALKQAMEALRVAGHSDKIPEEFRNMPQPADKPRRGRPPRVAENQAQAVA